MALPPTASIVNIDTIRDGVVILKSGELRLLLKVSSMNFSLKSIDEQKAIVFEYQNFLNALDFPIQIVVSSRYVNIDDYLASLRRVTRSQTSELLKMQTQEYIKFIGDFTKTASIVSTDFYIVVPFTSAESQIQEGGAGDRLRTLLGVGRGVAALDLKRFEHYRSQLVQRADFIANGLHRIGLIARALTTAELIVLYWSLYNANDLKKKRLLRPLFEE
jgi:hypothetical protein